MEGLLDKKARDLFEDTSLYSYLLAFDVDEERQSVTLFCRADPVKEIKLKFLDNRFVARDGRVIRHKKDAKRFLSTFVRKEN